MKNSDWVLIIPGKEGPKTAAALLLELAKSPQDVRTDSNGTEFRVPPYLAELYNPTPVVVSVKTEAAAPAPARRRRTKKEGDENGN